MFRIFGVLLRKPSHFLVIQTKFWYIFRSPKPLIRNSVKNLLILISLLLLSSLLTSCEKNEETLYKWKTSSGWEWKTMGDKNNNIYYQGEVKREYILFGDYILEGLGSKTYPDGDKYVGDWKDGVRNGQGIFTFGKGKHEGDKFVGEYKDGVRNGQGTYTWTNGQKYVGEWKDEKENGQGTMSLSNGEKFVGEYKDGRPWNITGYDKNGNIIGKMVNGVLE